MVIQPTKLLIYLPEGIGFFRQVDPAGTVPTFVSQPSSVVLKRNSVLRTPPHRRIESPSKSSACFRKATSSSGPSAGAIL